MKVLFLIAAFLLYSTDVIAGKPCQEMKAEIAAKLDGKGV